MHEIKCATKSLRMKTKKESHPNQPPISTYDITVHRCGRRSWHGMGLVENEARTLCRRRRCSPSCPPVFFLLIFFRCFQTSLKKGLVEENSVAPILAESRILASFSKPNPFISTQLLTLQDGKVGCASFRREFDLAW